MTEHDDAELRSRLAALDGDPRSEWVEAQRERLAAAWESDTIEPHTRSAEFATVTEPVPSRSTRARHQRLFAGAVAAVVLGAVVVGALVARHDAPGRIKVGGPGPVTTAPAVAAYAGCKGKVYVTGINDTPAPGVPGMVWAITTATGAVSAPITVAAGPSDLAITPDGKHAYVTNDDGMCR